MSALAKSAREKMKAKARSLASESNSKVDSSDWTPAEPLNADVKTGARPISKRQFKKGGKVVGKVEGKAAAVRADRKRRKSGGKVEAKEETKAYVNRDVRAANEERDGKKHVGGFKKGGKAKRADGGGVKDKQALGKIDPTPKRKAAQHYKAGGKAKKAEGGFLENIGNALAGKGYVDGSTWEQGDSGAKADVAASNKGDATASVSKPARRSRVSDNDISPAQARRELAMGRKNMRAGSPDVDTLSPEQADRELAMGRQNMGIGRMISGADAGYSGGAKRGGKVKKADGGEMSDDKPENDPRLGMVKPRLLTFGQNTVVPGQKSGGKVGRASKASKKQSDASKRMNRAAGGMVDVGALKKDAPKAKKGKTNINIVINAGKRDEGMPMDPAAMMPPPPQGVPVPMPPAGGPQGAAPQMPPMGAMPMGMPPAPPAPPPMAPPPPPQQMPAPRKSGGRVAKQIGGAMGFNQAQAGFPMAGAAPQMFRQPAPTAPIFARGPVQQQMQQMQQQMQQTPPRGPMPAPMQQQMSQGDQMSAVEQALRANPVGAPRSYSGNIAGPGIRPTQNLAIAPSATTYPTKQLLTPEQMAQIPTSNISLNEALRLFLPPQQAAEYAAKFSRQPNAPDATAAERALQQTKLVEQAKAEEARKAEEAKQAAARAAAEKAAAEKAAAEKAAAERAAAAKAAPPPAKSPAVQLAEQMAWQNMFRYMYSDRNLKTGVGRKSGGKVK